MEPTPSQGPKQHKIFIVTAAVSLFVSALPLEAEICMLRAFWSLPPVWGEENCSFRAPGFTRSCFYYSLLLAVLPCILM